MADFTQFSDTQVETLFEDWDAAEPQTNETTKFGITTADLFSRYSYYSKLINGRRKWEQESNQFSVDFETLLSEATSNVDPESMVKTFVQEKLSNGVLLRLTQDPLPAKDVGEPEDEPSIHEIDELEIPVNVIKRKITNVDKPAAQKTPSVLACVPLRIADIRRLEVEEKGSNSFQMFGLQFRLITFFGRITQVAKNEKWNQRYGIYTLDDGSGTVVVHFNHLQGEVRETYTEIGRVEQAMRLKQRQRNKANNRLGEISEDIRKILQLSRAQLRAKLSYYNRGDRAMVLGVPFLMDRDVVRIFAYEMMASRSTDCDFEIYFKNLLFNSYLIGNNK